MSAATTTDDRERRRKRREELCRSFFAAPVDASRYRIEKVMGEGAYGVVVSAIDTHSNTKVAVKRIRSVLDSYSMATRILRELKFLRFLSPHDNINSVLDVLIPHGKDRFNDVFVVLEYMPTDLGRLLRSRTVLNEQHIKYFMFQLLRAVNFMHSARVFHRDLNPNNILVDEDCHLRVCDFGLARAEFQRGDDSLFWTDYVATRWYRAPELILPHSTKYSTAIDMWSVGCIFAEMLGRGRPLFPGSDTPQQFALIVSVTGKPSAAVIESLGDPRIVQYLNSLPSHPRRSLSQIYRDASAGAIDLLQRLLAFDPNERITAAEALALPYFEQFSRFGPGATTAPLNEDEFLFERTRLPAEQMRQHFLDEIMAHHPELQNQPTSGRHGHYMVASQAGLFRQDMHGEEIQSRRKHRTLSTDVFAQINPESNPANPGVIDYKSTTMGEAELSKVGGAPAHHASSVAKRVQYVDGAVAMEE